MEERIQAILKERFGRDLDNCTKSEIFEALMVITKQEMAGRKRNTGNKKLYYISAEFLIGKLLSNNLINLGMLEPLSGKLTTDESKFNGVLDQLTAEDGNYYAVPFRSDFWVADSPSFSKPPNNTVSLPKHVFQSVEPSFCSILATGPFLISTWMESV